MGTLQRNAKGRKDRYMHKSFGRSLFEGWLDIPYVSTPKVTDAEKAGDTSKSSSLDLHPTNGYGYKSRRGKKRNNRCSSRRK